MNNKLINIPAERNSTSERIAQVRCSLASTTTTTTKTVGRPKNYVLASNNKSEREPLKSHVKLYIYIYEKNLIANQRSKHPYVTHFGQRGVVENKMDVL